MIKSIPLLGILLLAIFFSAAQKIVVPGKTSAGNENTLWKTRANKESKEGAFMVLELDLNEINELYRSRPVSFLLQIPDEGNGLIEVDLSLQNIPAAKVKINNSTYLTNIWLPVCYRGKARGITQKHDVLLTLAPGYISMQAILPGKSIVIEKENRGIAGDFILYNSAQLQLPAHSFACGLPERPADYPIKSMKVKRNESKPLAPLDKCIFVFIDCTDSLFINRGTVQNTINYVYSIWNDVRTAYQNEQINIGISELNVWTVPAPFNTTTRALGIQTFAGYYKDDYTGNMAMLMDWSSIPSGRSAVAGGYGWAKGINPRVCPNYDATPNPSWNWGSFIYNDLNYYGNYQNFPVPALQQQVYSSVHEIGHLLNSSHTHWCGWPGGPIDNCAPVEPATTPPTCSAGPTPVNGGTFMSYCINTGQFMNFNNGFGPLPGNTIRDFTDGNDCLNNCGACTTNNTIGAIMDAGAHQFEVTNQITANGLINGYSISVKLDAGNRVLLQPGFRALEGSKVQVFIEGCGGIR